MNQKMLNVALASLVALMLVFFMMPLSSQNETEDGDSIDFDADIDVDSDINADDELDDAINIGGFDVETNLTMVGDSQVALSDGQTFDLAISPEAAAEISESELRINSCEIENGCNIEIIETESNGEPRAAYEVTAEKKYEVFGIFDATADVSAEVDTETGEVIDINRPWWVIISGEVEGEAPSEFNETQNESERDENETIGGIIDEETDDNGLLDEDNATVSADVNASGEITAESDSLY